ncbi:MAG TPA: GlsB/YeaQ/YmgE family stress response membrane protein [Candidatus Baltobacteraceae bacterium]|nr:GlsB/YeaQ/YmgE family stress response membrane protein [Candidatus Baltobacteraceae bacterium]
MLVETVVGFCVGVIARYIVPDSPGIGSDTLTGIVGGGLGAFIYKLFGHRTSFDAFNAWSIASAAIGAFILILVIRATAGRRTIA